MLRRPSVDNSIFRLRRAGWSAGDVAFCSPQGDWVWFVSAYKQDDWISTGGLSQEEAWDEAARKAESVDWNASVGRSRASRQFPRHRALLGTLRRAADS